MAISGTRTRLLFQIKDSDGNTKTYKIDPERTHTIVAYEEGEEYKAGQLVYEVTNQQVTFKRLANDGETWVNVDNTEAVNALQITVDAVETRVEALEEHYSAYLAEHVATPLDIGTAGELGFGQGYISDSTELTNLEDNLDLRPLTGTSDPSSKYYGTYYSDTHNDLHVCIPKFYVRYGSEGAVQYETYGKNSVEVLSPEALSYLSTADAEGFVLMRSATDGGSLRDYFLRSKYMAGTTDGDVLVASNTLEVCSIPDLVDTWGQTYACNFIDLAQARGEGWNICTCFMAAAQDILSIAHGQAANSEEYCAWYDPELVLNFPRKYNAAGSADTSSGIVERATVTDIMYLENAHNGQECGIMDNGYLWELVTGMTTAGSSSTSTATSDDPDIYLLSEDYAMKDINSGYGSSGDAWGTASNLASGGVYKDAVSIDISLPSSSTSVYWGNGDNAVFTDPTDSTNGRADLFGVVPAGDDAVSSTGSNLMGQALIHEMGRANMFLAVKDCGTTSGTVRYAPFSRSFCYYRSLTTNTLTGTRLGAYPYW